MRWPDWQNVCAFLNFENMELRMGVIEPDLETLDLHAKPHSRAPGFIVEADKVLSCSADLREIGDELNRSHVSLPHGETTIRRAEASPVKPLYFITNDRLIGAYGPSANPLNSLSRAGV